MANEPKKVRQRRSMLQIPGVQTILSSLLCIVLGLLVGFVVLLLIDHGVSEKTGNLNAIDAILVIIKNFWKYGSSTAQMKYLGNTLVKTAPLLMCGLSVLFAYLGGLVYITAGVSEWKFENGVAGFGFLALAVMIFGQWKPLRIALAALLFGLFRSLSNVYTGFDFLAQLNLPSTFYNMLPYIISLLVLALTSSKSRAPKAEGIPYDKGSR